MTEEVEIEGEACSRTCSAQPEEIPCDALLAALVLGVALIPNLYTAVSEALLDHSGHHWSLTEGVVNLNLLQVDRKF